LAGFTLARVSGSHHTFTRGAESVTVPHRRPTVLPVYVRDVLARTAPPQEPEGED
jgi:predicted RNA binding protein YcfA (HicA-like mRNA interferase family)